MRLTGMRLSWWKGRRRAPKGSESESTVASAQETEQTPGPDAAPAEAPTARRLWGKEFSVAAQGLDEAQVAAFVNDLISRYNFLLQEYESVKLVRGFSKQVLEDTERQAATVRARAQREAELEAARILSEVQQQANQTLAQAKQRAEEITGQEVRDLIQSAQREAELESARVLSEAQQQANQTLAQTKRRAEEITGQEVRDLIQTAQRRAELVERQAKIVAQKFLLQVRDEVQGQIANEVQAAYYKLMSTVEELLTVGQSIETEWKSKTYQLMSAAPLELEEHQSHFLDTLLTERFTPSESVGALGPERPGDAPSPMPPGEEILEPPPVADRSVPSVPEVVEDVVAPPVEAPTSPARPAQGAPTVRPTVAPAEEAPDPTVMRGSNELGVLSRMAEGRPVGTPQDIPTAESPLREGDGAPPSMGGGQGRAVKLPQEGSVPPSTPEAAPQWTRPADDRLYDGEVDIIIGTSVDFQSVAKFYSNLQSLRGLQILRTTGDWNVGTTVTVALDTPTPLVSLLESIPSVRVTADARETGAGKGEKRARVAVTIEGDT